MSRTETNPQSSLELLASYVIKFGLFGITLWFNICITLAVDNPIFPQFHLTFQIFEFFFKLLLVLQWWSSELWPYVLGNKLHIFFFFLNRVCNSLHLGICWRLSLLYILGFQIRCAMILQRNQGIKKLSSIHSEKAMAPHSSTLAWKIPWTEEPGRLQSMGSLSQTWLNDFAFTFHFHASEKEMVIHSSVLAWRFLGMAEHSRLPSMGSHRVGHDWRDLAAAAASIHCLPWAQHQAKCFTCNMFVHNSKTIGKI